ncbi:MAG: Hsp70 family protein [Kiritimatiellae bacterium]|nr:Hsp70 family protein [Kiritimatiellia bacterium]
MQHSIGIDFGTTKTMVSYFNPVTGRAELVRLGRDRDSIPTTVHVDEAAHYLFGEDADDQIETDPEGYCRAFKLHLGESESVLPRANATAESLTEKFLRQLKIECEQRVFHGEAVTSATVTIPVSFAPARKMSLKNAAERAGFASVSFMPEPEAAGVAFLRDNPTDRFSRALVLDWGGGTLDIAIISREEDGTIHADHHCAEGRDDVGGEEMDRGLLVNLDMRWNNEFGKPLITSGENEPKLLREAEKVKIGLSRKEIVPFRRVKDKIDISRDQFRQIVEQLLDAAVELVQSSLSKNREQGHPEPDAILLIGGTSLSPVVKETMEKSFAGLRVLSWHHSHEAVALGATAVPRTPTTAVSPELQSGSGNHLHSPAPAKPPEPFSPNPKLGVCAPSTVDPHDPAAAGFADECRTNPAAGFPFFGFGAEDRAVGCDAGLLVYRKRFNCAEYVPADHDGNHVIDLLSVPSFGNMDLLAFWTGSADLPSDLHDSKESSEDIRQNPFLEDERSFFGELVRVRNGLVPMQEEIDWYRSHSREGYEWLRRRLRTELASRQAELVNARKSFENSRKSRSQRTGLFGELVNTMTSFGHGFREVAVETAQSNIDKKQAEIKANDAEERRHAEFDLHAAFARLQEAEAVHLSVYRKYCRARHFRIRVENEIWPEFNVLGGLVAETDNLRREKTSVEKEIEMITARLPALKSSVASMSVEVERKSAEITAMRESINLAERSLRESYGFSKTK